MRDAQFRNLSDGRAGEIGKGRRWFLCTDNTERKHDRMAELPEDTDFLEYVVKAIVDHPDDVKVGRTVDEMGVLLTLHVHPEDMGEVIGRSGNTAKSLRTLLRIVGLRRNARVNLKIEEPEGGRVSRPRSDAPAATAASADDVQNVVDELKSE